MRRKRERSSETDPRDEVLRGEIVMPERVRAWQDDFHVLHVSVDDREFHDVRPRRLFPLSGKADLISFIAEDGREVLLLAHPHKLDRRSRACVERALGRMYYMPKIVRVDSITEAMGVAQWKVMTDRGYAVFEIAERNRDIRMFAGGRYVISDVDGNRFEIEDINALDERSRNVVESET